MALTPLKPSSPPSVNSVLQSNPGDRVSADKAAVAPVVAVLSRQMPLPQAQQLAGQTAMVRVLKSGPGSEAELDFNGMGLQVKLPPGRTLTAGEMITVAFALNDKDGPAVGATGGKARVQEARNLITPLTDTPDDAEGKSPSFVDRLSGSARLLGMLERLGQNQPSQLTSTVSNSIEKLGAQIKAALQAGIDVLAGSQPEAPTAGELPSAPTTPTATAKADTQARTAQEAAVVKNTQFGGALAGQLAKEVSSAVENSGLFYESHLEQWVRGERTTEQLAKEPQAKFQDNWVISEKGIDSSAVNQSVRMVTAQLAALDHQRVNLALSGLMGHPVNLEIEPDEQRPEDQPAAENEGVRPWVAKLKLDMPTLGELNVRVRVIGSQCDVQISGPSQSKAALAPYWGDFQAAMSNRGLNLVHGQFVSREGESP